MGMGSLASCEWRLQEPPHLNTAGLGSQTSCYCGAFLLTRPLTPWHGAQEDKAHRLMRNLDLLQQDRVFLEQNEQVMVELAKAAQQHIAEQHRRMEDEAQAHQVRQGRCTCRVIGGRRCAMCGGEASLTARPPLAWPASLQQG
jgi:hypothetical protein